MTFEESFLEQKRVSSELRKMMDKYGRSTAWVAASLDNQVSSRTIERLLTNESRIRPAVITDVKGLMRVAGIWPKAKTA